MFLSTCIEITLDVINPSITTQVITQDEVFSGGHVYPSPVLPSVFKRTKKYEVS